jgi:CRP-like cAMP-binding protein
MMDGQPELLKGLSREEVDQALSFGSHITIRAGAELFHLGEPADRLFVVERGRVRLTLPMQVRGQEENILVEESAPGQTVGWSALIPPYRFTLTATAPLETEVIALSRDALREYFAVCPSVGYTVSLNLAAVIGQRLQIFQAMWLREMQRTVEAHGD